MWLHRIRAEGAVMQQAANGIVIEKGIFRVVRRQRRVRPGVDSRPIADGRAVDLRFAGLPGGVVALSAAERGVPMDPMPWSFWLVLRLGEAMLAAGAIGLGWGLLRLAGVVLGKLAG